VRKTFLIGLSLMLGLILAVPATTAGAEDDDCGRRDRRELRVIGLTADQNLICFGVQHPGDASTIGAVTDLVSDGALVGIDYRPATSEL
jgi:hypothetical protein